MRFLGLFLSTSVFALAAFASPVGNYAGHWVGTGSVNDNTGWSSQCTDMQTDIRQTASTISIKYKFICGEVTEENEGIDLQISGNQLIYAGQVYGTINSTNMHVDVKSDQMREVWNIDKLSNKQVKYSEVMTMGNSSMTTNGVLNLK